MHQTTGRFDDDVWRQLGLVCRRIGISKAQFVRDATVEKLARVQAAVEVEEIRRDLDAFRVRLGRIEHRVSGRRP
jgi:hypothetical protein